MNRPVQRIGIGALLVVGAVESLRAQEPTFMDAATHPGAGRVYTRLLLSGAERKTSAAVFDEQSIQWKLAYGIHTRLAALAEGEFLRRRLANNPSYDEGWAQTTLRLKYRQE